MLFSIFASYALVIQMHMPMDHNTKLDRTSTYTFSGYKAKEHCETERQSNLHTKTHKGDKLVVGECKRIK